MNKYYVYGHYYEDNDELFYIGKGSGKRLDSPDRSVAWKNATKNREWYSKIIINNLSNKEALDIELKLIRSSNVINTDKSSETKDIDECILSMFYYDETSPTCLKYAKDSVGTNGRVYKEVNDIAGILKVEPLRKKKRYTIRLDGKLYYAHRIVFGLFNELDINKVVDHVDGNSLNNKISNLRQVQQEVNSRNINKRKSSTSAIGVSLVKRKRLTFEQYVASYYDSTGKLIQKEFTTFKKDKEEAFRLACEWRKEQIKLLNEQGAGYTERHGT